MATGSYDANGIWNYGEDDNIALFSDTLNMLAESTSDAFTDDRARLSTLEAGSLSGLIPINPMTITAVGGTVAKNDLGAVTFTGSTVVSLNSVFTSAYRNYRIIFSNVTMGTFGQTISMRLRAAGVDYAASYGWNGVFQTGTGVPAQWHASGALNWNLCTAAIDTSIVIDLQNPATTNRTVGLENAFGWSSANQAYFLSLIHEVGAAFDGFTFFASAGNFSGVVQVFGYND